MKDYKYLSNNAYRPHPADRHPPLWLELLTGALAGIIMMGIMFHGFMLSTGGY